MPHNLLIVGILTIGFSLASFLAYIMQRIGLPTILGYLIAGYIIGPYSPGFVANTEVAEQLAEVGVILMLFGVGLHFKIEDLIRVKNIAIPGAIAQTFFAALFTTLFVYGIGWSLESGLIIGLSVGVASTVVLVRLLMDNHILNTTKGHIAVGWLVVEDIFTVIILILLPTLALYSAGENISFAGVAGSIIFVLAKFLILISVMFTLGHKFISYILKNVARVRSQELFTLTILALVFLIATGSAVIFGTSIALGAFIAGMVIGKTNVKHQAASNALPLKDIFSVIFFLSVGMLFNPEAIATNWFLFLGIIFVILVIKPVVAYLITIFLGYSLNTSLTVAISLAQIGEFSFILAEEAMNLKILPDDGFDLLVACALISISLNPLLFQAIGYVEKILKKFKFGSNQDPNECILEKKMHSPVIIIGFGPVGKKISKILKEAEIEPTIIEENIDTVSNMEDRHSILFGDATQSDILKQAHIKDADYLIITAQNKNKAVKIIDAARQENPRIKIISRIQYISEIPTFENLNVIYVCSEGEALNGFTSLIKKLFLPELKTES